ncbi:MAG: Uma2 family endonuclease [Chroococcidiopsidaceae cyanobacterium CP_BM_ER_R8_30]|nr:Uma2 family endonuclease [Chroococcidiopsidaceae cyanobacterium CP_BM_ER_R8_30]
MKLQLNQIDVQPGERIILRDIRWGEFEQIVEELGHHPSHRIAYYKGTLEIMVPLPGHEDRKEIIGDLVKVLLEEFDIEFRSLGSSTFKQQIAAVGVEPDACFYIQNEAMIRGKDRIDLSIDPPPDLAIEVDYTTDSQLKKSSYEALGVPELWLYNDRALQIYVLREHKYVESDISLNFPTISIANVISQYFTQSRIEGRNKAIKAFRSWVFRELAQ